MGDTELPIAIRKRGGRKVALTPSGDRAALTRQQPSSALTKAVARAFRWREMLESGATITELARPGHEEAVQNCSLPQTRASRHSWAALREG